jgi:putative SOS response-associated peptidase YedK
MCGRYNLTTPPEALKGLFGLEGPLPNFPTRYNLAPTQPAPVVRLTPEGTRELVLLRWGLVPPWSEGPESAYSMINARAETIAEKPAFRAAFRARRCLVPADGFYEWQAAKGAKGPKQPYHVRLKSGGPFAFAGLWERWEREGQPRVESFTIVVTEANRALRPIHDRMPVILDPADYGRWLDAEKTAAEEALALLKPAPSEVLVAEPVGTHVNNPKHDDPRCIAPLAPAG